MDSVEIEQYLLIFMDFQVPVCLFPFLLRERFVIDNVHD